MSVSHRSFFLFVIAIFIGLFAALGAYVFRLMIGFVHNVIFSQRLDLLYDANQHSAIASPIWLLLILIPLASLLVVWLIRSFAPEAKGHGVPEVLDAIHYKNGVIRPVVVAVKAAASAISIGSGGSVGREGPIIQMGAAFGSTIGAWFKLSYNDRVILLSAGAGAGIAATFNTPLGGVVFAIELFLLNINRRALLILATSVTSAIFLSRLLLGQTPSFNIPALQTPDYAGTPVYTLLAFSVLGICIGIFAAVFIKSLYFTEDILERKMHNPYFRHFTAMFAVALIIVGLQKYFGHYYVQGVGYASIMGMLRGTFTVPLFLLLLLLSKLAVTCLTLGSGGSGGIFSPSLFMGGSLGTLFGILFDSLVPGYSISLPVFALVGMAAMFGATTGAYLTAIIMLLEMTYDPNIILPLILAVCLAIVTRKVLCPASIYSMKLVLRGKSLPEGLTYNPVDNRLVSDIMNRNLTVTGGDPASLADLNGIELRSGGRTWQLHNKPPIAGAQDAVRYHSYCVVDEASPISQALRVKSRSGAQVIVVSGRSAAGGAVICGIITSESLASEYERINEILS
ncbi:MAG: chloride channel protein [Alphaproteobacteria bacterium]|nr:chloride channel protein [Alphaproteobacteria bacterium]